MVDFTSPTPHHTMTSIRSFFIRRSHTTFSGKVIKVDFIGPYREDQEFAVAMQRSHDMRKQVPAETQITKWEWVERVPEMISDQMAFR